MLSHLFVITVILVALGILYCQVLILLAHLVDYCSFIRTESVPAIDSSFDVLWINLIEKSDFFSIFYFYVDMQRKFLLSQVQGNNYSFTSGSSAIDPWRLSTKGTI
jgi:hypothetical protein